MKKMRFMKELEDARIQCPYCKIKTWMRDRRAFMRDHDRPDGRRCEKARQSVASYRVLVRTPDGERPIEPVTRSKVEAEAVRDSMTRMAEAKGWRLTYRIRAEREG
jgi:hypothetical protein